MKPISLQPYTLRELVKDGNALDIMKQVADIGYEGLEGPGFGLSVPEFGKAVKDLGMRVSSYFGGFPTLDNVGQFIEDAKTLEVQHTVSGLWIPDFESLASIEESARKVNAVLPQILDAGLSFSLHNHWAEFWMVEGRFAIQRLVDLCPGLTLEIDTYWSSAFGANDPAKVLAQFADIAPLLHIKDGPLVQGQAHVAVGSGKMDFHEILSEINPNITDWLVVELDECDGDMMEAVRDSYRYLVGEGLADGRKPA